jgi:hypothetical protein
MNKNDIKTIKTFCEGLDSKPDWKEVVTLIDSSQTDFEVDGVRFIEDSEIQGILEDELASDPYLLGCFYSHAIAEATGWPEFLVELAQAGDQHEALGNAMNSEDVAVLAELYESQDGYGHHFNRHDGSEEELTVNSLYYHVFDNQ